MERLEYTKELHPEFVLRRKRNQVDNTKEYKAKLVVCEKRENDIDSDCFLRCLVLLDQAACILCGTEKMGCKTR